MAELGKVDRELFDEMTTSGLFGDTVEAAREGSRTCPVRDAPTAAAVGDVTAMHDATECGVYGSLFEMVRAGGVYVDGDPVEHPGPNPFRGAFEENVQKLEGEVDER